MTDLREADLWTRENIMTATALIQEEWAERGKEVQCVYWDRALRGAEVEYVSLYEMRKQTRRLDQGEVRHFLERAARERKKITKPDVPHVEEIRKWLAEQTAKRMDEWAKELFRRAAKEYEKMTKEEE